MKIILILCLSLFTQFAFAAPVSAQEKRVRWVWSQMMTFMKACALSDDCPLSEDEDLLLRKIIFNQDHYSEATLQFVAEKDQPGLFTSQQGEAHRLMTTGFDPTSPIYINTSRILDSTSPQSIDTLFGLFAHELVHHLGYKDDALRLPDQFGVKISELVRKNLIVIDLDLKNVQAFVFNMPTPIRPKFIEEFPKGLHPRFLMMTSSQFMSQDFGRIHEQGADVCGQGADLWSTQAAVSHVGEREVSGKTNLSIELKLIARCFQKESQVLQEVFYYLLNRLEVENKSGNLLLGTFSFNKNSFDQNSVQTLNVISVQAPSEIQGGTTLQVEVLLENPFEAPVKGCAGQFTSPQWTSVNKEDIPLVAATRQCQILSHNGSQFRLRIQLAIPANTPDGTVIRLNQVYLQTMDNNYVMGKPPLEVLTRIHSSAQSNFEFKGIQFGGVIGKIPNFKNAYYIQRGQPIEILFQFSGARGLQDAYFKYVAQLITKEYVLGSLPLISDIPDPRVKTSVGADGLLTVSITLDTHKLTPKEVIVIGLKQLVAVSSDWHYFDLNLESLEYSISVVEPK